MLRRFLYYRKAYVKLRKRFRNWVALAVAHMVRRPIGTAELRDGQLLSHPANQRGLADAVVEIWGLDVYAKGHSWTPSEGDVVLDAGANIGLFSLWILSLQPRCTIIAIEPMQDNLHHLRSNLARYGDRVTVVPVALSTLRGVGHMKTSGRSLDHRLGEHGVEVNLALLDDVVSQCVPPGAPIALLKMDIEGNEADVLEQLSDAVLRRTMRLSVEYHDNIRPHSLRRVRERLAASHTVSVIESSDDGYGVIWCELRGPGQENQPAGAFAEEPARSAARVQ